MDIDPDPVKRGKTATFSISLGSGIFTVYFSTPAYLFLLIHTVVLMIRTWLITNLKENFI